MTTIEVCGFIFALLGVLLAIKQIKWNWISNMISSAFYFLAFKEVNLIADSYLQILFFTMGVVGFINWNNPKYSSLEAVSSLNKRQMAISAIAFLFLVSIIYWFTANFTPSDFPFWDGSLTAASVIATFLAIQKKIENWILWIFIDLAYIPLYVIKGYVLSSLLYGIYVVLAYMAYREWKKHLA